MLSAYRDAHPKSHFTLVGHSLGGVIAFEAAVRDAPRDKDSRLEIDGVITLDAPLLGVSADKKPIIDLIPCEKTYIAGAELVALRADAGAAARRAAEAAALRDAGIRLATLGSTTDCLLDTSHCTGGGFIDDGFSQYLDGAGLSRAYDVPAAPLVSHDAILAFPPAVADAVAFAGKP
jgi:pimeloyl-ACP methyl ester carboxylesterase